MNHQTIRSVFAPARPVIGAGAERFRLRMSEPQRATPGKPQSRVVMRPTSTIASIPKVMQPAAYSLEHADGVLELCTLAGVDLKRAKSFISQKLSPRQVTKILSAEQRLRETNTAPTVTRPPGDVMLRIVDAMKNGDRAARFGFAGAEKKTLEVRR